MRRAASNGPGQNASVTIVHPAVSLSFEAPGAAGVARSPLPRSWTEPFSKDRALVFFTTANATKGGLYNNIEVMVVAHGMLPITDSFSKIFETNWNHRQNRLIDRDG